MLNYDEDELNLEEVDLLVQMRSLETKGKKKNGQDQRTPLLPLPHNPAHQIIENPPRNNPPIRPLLKRDHPLDQSSSSIDYNILKDMKKYPISMILYQDMRLPK